jgi:hypothetical protein
MGVGVVPLAGGRDRMADEIVKPDCVCGHRVTDLGDNEQLQLCYSEFRKHCMRLGASLL